MKQGWTYKKLGDCFPYIKNGANIKQIKGADGLPITRIETLSGGVFNRDRMGYAGIYNLDKYSDYVLEDGDLLLSHINSKTYIGRTVEYRAKNDETIIHGMNLLRLKSNSKVINSSFFAYYTLSNDFKTNVAKIRKDAVNQSSIAISDIRKFSIPVPPIQSQQYIVAELDKINELIRLKKEQLKHYDNLAQSILYEMFGDPVVNEKGWEVKKLGELCVSKLKYGSGASAVDFDGNIRYVRITDINEDGTLNNDIKSPNIVDDEYLLNVGDIVFARSGATVGKTYLHRKNNIKCLYAGYLIKATLNTKMALPIYVFQFTQSKYYKDWVNLNARAVAQPNINAKQYGDLQIPLPPLTLQQVFAQRIELIEQQKAEIQNTIADLETLLASRMQYWFD